MKQILLLLAVVMLASSCRLVTKLSTKRSEKTEVKTEVNSVSTQTATGSTTATASRTVTEEFDTTRVIKGSEVTGTVQPNEVKPGKEIKIEDDRQLITIVQDSTGAFHVKGLVKDQKINQKGKRTIIENTSSQSHTAAVNASTLTATTHSETNIKEKQRSVEREPGNKFLVIALELMVFLLAGATVYIVILRKKNQDSEDDSV